MLAVRGVSHIRGRAASESPLPHAASPDCAARKSLILLALAPSSDAKRGEDPSPEENWARGDGGPDEMARWALPIAGSLREARSALDANGLCAWEEPL